MNMNEFLNIIKENLGKIAGAIVGLIVGIFFLTIGFIKTIFLLLCVFIGIFIGGRYYNKKKLIDFLDKHLPW
ncbi:DUF2273 domain-containing protein [Caldicellulosiruptoraceae bacterium PP1]